METQPANTSFGSHFAQIAWVVPDIHATEKFFREVLGIGNFVKLENIRSEENEGEYYGKPDNYVFHLYLAYSGESMIELIQPVSGNSIFQEYLDNAPNGGIQHIAYMVPVAELGKAVSELTGKGYPVVQSLNLPVAHVAFFDTRKGIGLMTEIIGLTEAGVQFVQQLKGGGEG